MAIDYNAIQTELIKLTRDLVGAKLSQMPNGSGGTFPAVIKPRTKGVRPSYPYITVDIVRTTRIGSWLRNTGVDENNRVFYEADYHLDIAIRGWGNGSHSILQDLKSRFAFDSTLWRLRNNIGAGVMFTGDVVMLPQFLSTDYVDNASLNLTISVRDRVVDTSSGIINQIDIGYFDPDIGESVERGELKYSPDDTDPLYIQINVP
jgi:hypothetical protein